MTAIYGDTIEVDEEKTDDQYIALKYEHPAASGNCDYHALVARERAQQLLEDLQRVLNDD